MDEGRMAVAAAAWKAAESVALVQRREVYYLLTTSWVVGARWTVASPLAFGVQGSQAMWAPKYARSLEICSWLGLPAQIVTTMPRIEVDISDQPRSWGELI